MQCINGHELPQGQERHCPTCGEPARSLVSAARRDSAKNLPLGVALFLVPIAVVVLIAALGLGPIRGPLNLVLALVLTLPLLAGLAGTFVAFHGIIRAPAVVRRRIRRATEPMDLASFVCPKCTTPNQGPFAKNPPRCESCDTAVIGVRCWRCGTEQPQEALDGAEPRKEYACTKCKELQEMPALKTEAWWR